MFKLARWLLLVAAAPLVFLATRVDAQQDANDCSAFAPQLGKLTEICDVRLSPLPDEFAAAVKVRNLWQAIERASVARTNDEKLRAEQALACVKAQDPNQVEPARKALGTGNTGELKMLAYKAWQSVAFYTKTWERKSNKVEAIPPERLRHRLGLVCLDTPDSADQTLALIDDFSRNLRWKDAEASVAWAQEHEDRFTYIRDGELDALAKRLAEIKRQQENCPSVSGVLPAIGALEPLKVASSLDPNKFDERVVAYRRAYCESGDDGQIFNAAVVLRDGKRSDDATALVQKLGSNRSLNANTAIVPLLNQRELAKLSGLWKTYTKDSLFEMTRILARYRSALGVDGADPSAAYLEYVLAFLVSPNQAQEMRKQLVDKLALAKARRQGPLCKDLEPLFSFESAPEPDKLFASCSNTPVETSPGTCGPRQVATEGTCCYETKRPNSQKECVGLCPADMIESGWDSCACPGGMTMSSSTDMHCCWPGQVWKDGRCVGEASKIRCGRGYTKVDAECWPEDRAIELRRASCEKQAEGEACMVVAQSHWSTLRDHLKKANVGAHDKIPAEFKAAGKFVLNWLELACDHGQPEGCLQSAHLAKDLGENQIAQRRAFQAHTSGLPEGSFALAVLVSDRKEQRRLLEAVCEPERSNPRTGVATSNAYDVYGAPEGCGSLVDSLLKDNERERAAKINQRICLAKQQRLTDEGDSNDRSNIRKACERGASYFRAIGSSVAGELLEEALYVFPSDSTWAGVDHEGWTGWSNKFIRDTLSGQSSDSYCGDRRGRPNNIALEQWLAYRCIPPPKSAGASNTCLRSKQYNSAGHGCPGTAAPDLQLCCPIAPPKE